MNRQQVIAKIQSMLKLQENTDFEGEAAAAASLIDKLCKQYGISVTEATEVQILDESFVTFKRINNANAILLNAVANFYDAKAYIKNADVKSLQIIGSEAQQIQVRLYFDYLYQVMERECNTAYVAEKVLAELTGGSVSRSFKTNFRKAFADKVKNRLKELKIEEGRCHKDANAVKAKMSTLALRSGKRMTGPTGAGAFAGSAVGSNVSLRRQASGSAQKALCGV
jgi:hypothetical protein